MTTYPDGATVGAMSAVDAPSQSAAPSLIPPAEGAARTAPGTAAPSVPGAVTRHMATGRGTDRALFAFYATVAAVALAGQAGAAVEWLHWWPLTAVGAVAAAEFGGIVLSAYADHRRRLGERALFARTLSAAVAAGAVALNWLGHADHLPGGFFAGMSALGYLVWLLHSGARRRDALRAAEKLPPVAPVYGWWSWLRHPDITRRARTLALVHPTLGLYGSLAAARDAVRTERRQAAIAAVLRRKIEASTRDPLSAEIAVTVYDLDTIAARLAAGADYDGLTALLAADLDPVRLATSPADADPSPQLVPEPSIAPAPNLPPELPAEVRVEVRGRTEPASSELLPPAEGATSRGSSDGTSGGRKAPRKGETSTATSTRRAAATSGGSSGRTSARRSTGETRELAAQLRGERPGINNTEVARLLGISTTRLRQVESEVRHVNGTKLPPM